jgi:hypothetical protein
VDGATDGTLTHNRTIKPQGTRTSKMRKMAADGGSDTSTAAAHEAEAQTTASGGNVAAICSNAAAALAA